MTEPRRCAIGAAAPSVSPPSAAAPVQVPGGRSPLPRCGLRPGSGPAVESWTVVVVNTARAGGASPHSRSSCLCRGNADRARCRRRDEREPRSGTGRAPQVSATGLCGPRCRPRASRPTYCGLRARPNRSQQPGNCMFQYPAVETLHGHQYGCNSMRPSAGRPLRTARRFAPRTAASCLQPPLSRPPPTHRFGGRYYLQR